MLAVSKIKAMYERSCLSSLLLDYIVVLLGYPHAPVVFTSRLGGFEGSLQYFIQGLQLLGRLVGH